MELGDLTPPTTIITGFNSWRHPAKPWGSTKPPFGSLLDWTNPINNKLVGCWLFNDGQGNRVTDLVSTNHGTLNNFPTPPKSATSGWTTGKFGPTIVYDGSNDYVSTARFHNELEGVSLTSISFWYKRTAVSDQIYLFKGKSGGGADDGRLGVSVSTDGNVYCYVGTSTNGYGYFAQNDISWHHLCFIYNGTLSGSAKLVVYIDGRATTLNYSGTLPSTTPTTNIEALEFGRAQVAVNGTIYSKGIIDCVRLYTRILNPTEIQKLYNEPFVGILPTQRKQISVTVNKPVVQVLTGHKREPWVNSKPSIGALIDWTDPINKKLVKRFLFNEGQGLCTTNLVSNTLSQLVGMGSPPKGASSGWNSGKFGPTLTFDGSNDYISNGTYGQSLSFSWSAWVYINSNPASANFIPIIATGNDTGDGRIGVFNNYASAPVMTGFGYVTYNSDATNIHNTTGTLPTINTWYHVVMVRNGSSSISLYVNGNLVLSESTGGKAAFTGTGAHRIGLEAGSAPIRYFNGQLDNIAMFERAITSAEVKRLYSEPFAGIKDPRRRLIAAYLDYASIGSTVTGSGSLSFTFTSTAGGLADAQGSATSSFTILPTAIGASDAIFSGTTTFTMSPSGVGIADITGAGSSSFTISPTAIGAVDVTGSSNSSFSITTAATGLADAAGSGNTEFTISGIAIGLSVAQSSGSSNFSFDLIGSGQSDINSTGTIEFSLLGSGIGIADATGSSTSLFSFDSTGVGKSDAIGSSASAFNFNTSGIGAADATGYGASTFNFDISASGSTSAEGSGSGSSIFNFSVVGTGQSIATGSGTSSSQYLLSGEGKADAQGSGASTYNALINGIGCADAIGSSTTSFSFTTVASGGLDSIGSGSSIFNFSVDGVSQTIIVAIGSGLSSFQLLTSGEGKADFTGSGVSNFSFQVNSTTALSYSIGDILYWTSEINVIYWNSEIPVLYWSL